jgi:MULE transposase domain
MRVDGRRDVFVLLLDTLLCLCTATYFWYKLSLFNVPLHTAFIKDTKYTTSLLTAFTMDTQSPTFSDHVFSDPEFDDIVDQALGNTELNISECIDGGGNNDIEPASEDDSGTLIPANNVPQNVDTEIRDVDHESSDGDTSTLSSETNQSSQMPLPPEETFKSFKDLEEFTNKWSLQYGFELVRGRKNKKNKEGEICIRYLECSRHSRLSNTRKLGPEDRKRLKRLSRRIACPMSVIAAAVIRGEPNGRWEIRHRGEAYCSHNHGPLNPKALAGHRRRSRTQDVLSTVRDHRAAGVRPAQTLAAMQNSEKDCILIRKDLYNARMQVRHEELGNRTPIQALFSNLNEKGWFYRYKLGPDQKLEAIFLISPELIRWYKANPDLTLFDCTFKTNRYRRPLLNICGVSGENKTIQAGVAMIGGQAQEWYQWVIQQFKELLRLKRITAPRLLITDREAALMNALDEEFPHTPSLICRWHANKDVLAYVRTKLGQIRDEHGQAHNSERTDEFMKLYYRAIGAETEEAFTETCTMLGQNSRICAAYLEKNWWLYKEKLVAFWTNKHPHFGNQAASRLEGAHACLKRWLGSSRNDLYGLIQCIEPFWRQFTTELEASSDQAKLGPTYLLRDPIFDNTLGVICKYALHEAHTQFKLAKKELARPQQTTCRGVYRQVYGWPCKHDFIGLLERSEPLQPGHFDKHWWMNRRAAPQPREEPLRIFEPAVLRVQRRAARRGRQQAGAGVYGTRREPSYSERVDLNSPASPPRAPPPSTAPSVPQERITVVPPPPGYRPSQFPRATPAVSSQPLLSGIQGPSHYRMIAPAIPTPSQWQPAPVQYPYFQQHVSSFPQQHVQRYPEQLVQLPPIQTRPNPLPSYPGIHVQPDEDIEYFPAFKPARSHSYAAYSSFGTNAEVTQQGYTHQ